MKRRRRLSAIRKALPNFSNEILDQLVDWSFHFNMKNVTNELSIIQKWMSKIDKTLYDLSIQEFYDIFQRKINRHKHLKSINKRTDIIDLSLVEVFIQDKEAAEVIYKSMCVQKTNAMVTVMNNNPELKKGGTLQACIRKTGNEIAGRQRYDELNSKKGYSVSVQKFVDMGYNQIDAERLLSERQSTFTLKKCIDKHGEETGKKIWQDRQNRWQSTLNNKPQDEIDFINRKKSISVDGFMARGYSLEDSIELLGNYFSPGISFSKESCRMFTEMFPSCILNEARYANTEFYIYDHEFRCRRFYDFLYNGVIIEYHGIAFHPNPKTFSQEQLSSWRNVYTKEDADTVIARDQHKKNLAIRNGFYIFEIYSDMTSEEIVDIANHAKLMMLSRTRRS